MRRIMSIFVAIIEMTKCSQDTAIRDIQDLITKGILQKEAQGGRSTNYELIQSDID